MQASRIRADYQLIAGVAQAFTQQAKATQQTLASLKSPMSTLQSGDWVGEGAGKFYAEMNDNVLPTVNRLAEALDQASALTARINAIMQEAEADAAAVFRLEGRTEAAAAGAGSVSSSAAAFKPAGPGGVGFDAGYRTEKVLEIIGKWGRNASPFKIATLYFKLNKAGFSRLHEVTDAVKHVRELLTEVDGLEKGAQALNQATKEQYNAEESLPPYPLKTGDKVGPMVTVEELDYVEKYYNTAAAIANDAMDARAELDRAIQSWDAAVAQANKDNLFTRQAAWEAINDLNGRFSKQGGNFRAYLVDARDRAARTEQWARLKQFHAAHILGKWTTDWYKPSAT